MTDQPAAARLDLPDALAELGTLVLAEHSLDSVLQRIADVAERTIPGADEVSVTIIRDDPATAASTGDLARGADQLQYDRNSGPCLDAAESSGSVVVDDMAHETRWPDYTPAAAEHGVGSSLSVGLPVQQRVLGALNVYSRRPHAFDDDAVASAETFARYAAVAVANATLYQATADLAEQMQHALASRAVIDQAKGILMAQRGCTPDEAFGFLVSASQRNNRKLREIAQRVVDGVQVGHAPA